MPYGHFGLIASLVSRFMIVMAAMILIIVFVLVQLKVKGGMVIERSWIEIAWYGSLLLAAGIGWPRTIRIPDPSPHFGRRRPNVGH